MKRHFMIGKQRSAEELSSSTRSALQDRISRRQFIGSASVAATVGFTGCLGSGGNPGGNSTGKEYSRQTLSVTGFSGVYADTLENAIGPMFKEETGAELRVNRVTASHVPKIRAAPEDNPPFDVASVTGLTYKIGRLNDLWLKLRMDNIPNRDQIYQQLLDFRPTEYGLPVDGGLWTIVYKDEIGWEPQGWTAYTDPTAEKVSLRSDFWNFPIHIGALADQTAPGAEELYDESMHQSVIDTLQSMPIPSWVSTPADMFQKMQNDVINQAQVAAEVSLSDERIGDEGSLSVAVPTETTGYLDQFVVVRGTDKRDLAEKYINFVLEKEVQERWAEEATNFYANKNIEYPGDLGERMPTSSEALAKVAFPDWRTKLFEFRDKLSEAHKELVSQS